jgi:Replication-relaxation
VKRGRYVTVNRVAHIERRLGERDLAITQTLDMLRVATTEQLRRLHFTDLTQASASRQAPKVLARLASLGVLAELPQRVGGVRAGSAAKVWVLDTAGQRIASATGPSGGSRLRRPWAPSLPFVAHRLQVTDLYVEAVEASRAGACDLLTFEAEPLSWRRFAAPHGGFAYAKPDAYVRLGVRDEERGFFVEIDRGTQASTTIARKCLAYRRYWEAGREQARHGYFPRVVFAVLTETRKALIVDVFAAQPEESWPLFQVVLADDLTGTLKGEAS